MHYPIYPGEVHRVLNNHLQFYTEPLKSPTQNEIYLPRGQQWPQASGTNLSKALSTARGWISSGCPPLDAGHSDTAGQNIPLSCPSMDAQADVGLCSGRHVELGKSCHAPLTPSHWSLLSPPWGFPGAGRLIQVLASVAHSMSLKPRTSRRRK